MVYLHLIFWCRTRKKVQVETKSEISDGKETERERSDEKGRGTPNIVQKV